MILKTAIILGQFISERKAFGQAVNQLKQDLETKIAEIENAKLTAELPAIDVTAPFDSNTAKKPKLLRAENGSIHPINKELSSCAGPHLCYAD